MFRKLKNKRGESIIEALVSLLIAVISIALLVTSVTVATKINLKNKTRQTEALAFSYTDSEPVTGNQTAAITFTSEDDKNLSESDIPVTLKENNNYKYYELNTN